MRKQIFANMFIGAIIGMVNTVIYTLLFPLYMPIESFVTFFSFDGSFMWVVMLALGHGAALLVPNIGVGAMIGMLVSLPRYYRAARWLVFILSIFSSVFVFRIFLYDGSLIQAFIEGALFYPAAVVVTTLFYTFAFNRWVIDPSRRLPVEVG